MSRIWVQENCPLAYKHEGIRPRLRKGEAKKEVVDIMEKVAKAQNKGEVKLSRDEKVYFRPKMCETCQRYIDSDPGVTDTECHTCKHKKEREREKSTQPEENTKPEVEKTNTNGKVQSPEKRLLEKPTQHSCKLEGHHPSAHCESAQTMRVVRTDALSLNKDSETEKPDPPRIFCRFEGCVKTDHVIDAKDKCFIEIVCQDKCNIMLHRNCFNEVKGGVSEKSFLANDAVCITPDCPGNIICIRTKDFDGNIKYESLIKDKQSTWKKSGKTFSKEGSLEGGRTKGFKDKGNKAKDESKEEKNQGEGNQNTEHEHHKASTVPANDAPTTSAPSTFVPEPPTLRPIQEFLSLDESQLVKLERKDEEDPLSMAKFLKKRKKKKKRSEKHVDTDDEAALKPEKETELTRISKTDAETSGAWKTKPESTTVARSTWTSDSKKNNGLSGPSESTRDIGAAWVSLNTKAEEGAACASSTKGAAACPLTTKSIVNPISAIPPIDFRDIMPAPSSEAKETGYKLIESLVRTQGGEASMASFVNQMANWDEDIKRAMGHPNIKEALQKDPKKRFAVTGENISIIIGMDKYGTADVNVKDFINKETMNTPSESKDCDISETSNANITDDVIINCTASITHDFNACATQETTIIIYDMNKLNDWADEKKNEKADDGNTKEGELDCRPKITDFFDEKLTESSAVIVEAMDSPSFADIPLLKTHVREMEGKMNNMMKLIASQGELIERQSEEMRRQNYKITQLEKKLYKNMKHKAENENDAAAEVI